MGPAEGTGAGLAAEPEEVGELVAAHGTAGRGPHRMWGFSAGRRQPARSDASGARSRRRRRRATSSCRARGLGDWPQAKLLVGR